MSSEIVFEVSGNAARPLMATSLEAEGLLERLHLQQWVLRHPELLGDELLIITDEFDRWQDASGRSIGDRLDVLALDKGGRPVVVELKRGAAPRLTDLQAVGYAAMVSRFSVDDLVDAHGVFLGRQGTPSDPDEVRTILEMHTNSGKLSDHLLRSPSIVIMAESFAPAMTASVVWLSEQGVDISLREFTLYRSGEQLVLTLSQVWPVREVEDFTVRPRRQDAVAARDEKTFPDIEWSVDDLVLLRARLTGAKQEATVTTLLDHASASEDLAIGLDDLIAHSRRTIAEVRSDLAHLTMIAKADFGRNNWPAMFVQRRYVVSSATAAAWIASAPRTD